MKVDFIAQPDTMLGMVLIGNLNSEPPPKKVILVSAFTSLQTIIRMKEAIISLNNRGTLIRMVLGIDMGGTSQEVLKEVCSWKLDVKVVKHRIPGHTFHPKIFLFEWEDRAEIFVGSNNITEGGFFRNYEGSARIQYFLPNDESAFQSAQEELCRFLNPEGNTVYSLTEDFLSELILRGEIPTEASSYTNSNNFKKAGSKSDSNKTQKPLFGIEDMPPVPPLPASLLESLIKDVRERYRESRRLAKKSNLKNDIGDVSSTTPKIENILAPAAFYMTLPKLQNQKSNIPGEGRIPLEAIEIAQEFWGWPEEYARDESPRSGKKRVYLNWKPKWKIWSVDKPEDVIIKEIRMYMYENSSDFRFYARPLVNAGANRGDLVRISRIAQPDAEYECVLARQGTPNFKTWIKFCTQLVRNSDRKFGYA